MFPPNILDQTAKKYSDAVSLLTFSLPNVLFTTAACNFSTSALTKVLSECGVLYIFTSECAFRHSGMHFFNISTYKSGPNTSCFVHFDFRIAPQLSTSELQKVLRGRQFFNIFTSERAFRHSGVQFFSSSTYKSALGMRCFVHFHFRMCFSPQRHAFFQHQHVQKWSKHVMFCTFWLQNCSTAFDIRTSKSAPRTSVF